MTTRPAPEQRQTPMKPKNALLALAAASLLAACGGGGSAATDADPGELIQQGKIDEAVEVIEGRLATVEKGTADEHDLVLDHADALSYSDPAKAQKTFLDFAQANADLVTPKDFKYVVSSLRTQDAFAEAIDVMHAGKQRWPEDAEMVELLELIKADVLKAADPALAAKMKGLGYM